MTTIRIVRLSHAAQLDKTDPDVFDNDIVPEHLEVFLGDPRHLMFIAQDGDLVVGMISAVEYFHPDKPPQLWINEVGVAGTYRSQGIGKRLVRAVLTEASARGIRYSWLGTDVDNKPAQACFAGAGDGLKPVQRFLLYEWETSH
jgi:ribosomal protein S18 acetylase RimI-like enzyme